MTFHYQVGTRNWHYLEPAVGKGLENQHSALCPVGAGVGHRCTEFASRGKKKVYFNVVYF